MADKPEDARPEEAEGSDRDLDTLLAEADGAPAADDVGDDALDRLLSEYGLPDEIEDEQEEIEQPEYIPEDKSDEKPDFSTMSDAELGQWQQRFGYRTF